MNGLVGRQLLVINLYLGISYEAQEKTEEAKY